MFILAAIFEFLSLSLSLSVPKMVISFSHILVISILHSFSLVLVDENSKRFSLVLVQF